MSGVKVVMLKGAGGGHEFDCLADRRGLGGYFNEEFVKKYYL